MNENIQNQNQTEIEIDLREIFFAIKKWIWIIIIAGFLGGVIAFCYSRFAITPIFTAQNSMLVLTKETTLASLADLQMGTQLTNDYKVLTTSRPVLEEVISNLKLKSTYEKLKYNITVTNPKDTRILNITVKHPDPQLALDIAREVAVVSSDFIGEMMEVVPPKIIDKGVIPTKKTSPSNSRNAIIGALIGGILSSGVVILSAILDDSIKTEEDIEKYLELSILSSVPDRKDFIDQEVKSKSRNMKFYKRLLDKFANIKKKEGR